MGYLYKDGCFLFFPNVYISRHDYVFKVFQIDNISWNSHVPLFIGTLLSSSGWVFFQEREKKSSRSQSKRRVMWAKEQINKQKRIMVTELR